jgi:23S rRNA pseudouridine2605 synthase
MPEERLQRILAAHGIASRRSSEQMIVEGRVSVNGKTVTELGSKADPTRDAIRVDGHLLRPQPHRYLALNKPAGYITTMSDERGRRTVMDLVQVQQRVYPVGRLDRHTEGLLLLTNDGEVAHRLTHPSYVIDKEYLITTPSRPSEAAMQKVRDGLTLDGKLVIPERFQVQRTTNKSIVLKIVLHEGMNHVVRRLMELAQIEIDRLQRTRVGPIQLTGIPIGGWRDLRPGELASLVEAVGMHRAADFE